MGNYVETAAASAGVSPCGGSMTRYPAGGKITGSYVNCALVKTEAVDNGFDEAIMLTAAGHVSEGSAETFSSSATAG